MHNGVFRFTEVFLNFGDKIIKPDGREFIVTEKKTEHPDKFFWWIKDEPETEIYLRELYKLN